MSWTEVENFLREVDLKFPKHVWVLGVSGGGDSTFLAETVKNAMEKNKISPEKIILANVDHGQRKEANHEQQEIIKKRGKIFEVQVLKLNKGKLSESEMRKERMQFFEMIAKKQKRPALLLLGHNLTDKIETTILNILRGTGIKGFLNMKKIDYQDSKEIKAIVRPLLDLPREDIREALRTKRISFFEDITNIDPRISKRNLIRTYIDDFFKKYEFDKRVFYRSWMQIYTEISQKIEKTRIDLITMPFIWVGGQKHQVFKLMIDPLDFGVEKLQQVLKKIGAYQDITQSFLREMLVFVVATRRGIKYFKGWNFIKHDQKLYLLKGDYKFWENKVTLEDMKKMYGVANFPPKGDEMLAQGLSVSKRIKKHKIPIFLKYILPVQKKKEGLYILRDKLGKFL